MADRASGLVTILFTDLVDSTDLLSRAGDEEAERIFRAHHDLLAETAAARGGGGRALMYLTRGDPADGERARQLLAAGNSKTSV